MLNTPIGILDSGIGGLTVWREIIKELPSESVIYIADSKNIPYGNKSNDEIYFLAKKLVEFLLRKNVKVIVIACNTITVSALDRLRFEFPQAPIIGTVPVIKKAAEITRNKRIGIFSTTKTAESNYQKELIQRFAQDCTITTVGSDEIVPLIEAGKAQGRDMINVLERVLKPFKDTEIDTLCLGCTHFPIIENDIQEILGKEVKLLEPSSAIARHTKKILMQNNEMSDGENKEYAFYTTGDNRQFETVAKSLIQDTIRAEHLDL